MKFVVIDSGNPARYPNSATWGKCEFQTFEEAVEYANDWLGDYGPLPPTYKVGARFNYYDSEQWMEIRFLPSAESFKVGSFDDLWL